MVGFGGDKLFGVVQGSPHIRLGHPVFANDFGAGHAAGEATENPLHGNAGAPDDGFAVLDGGIDDDAVGHGVSLSGGGGLSRGWKNVVNVKVKVNGGGLIVYLYGYVYKSGGRS